MNKEIDRKYYNGYCLTCGRSFNIAGHSREKARITTIDNLDECFECCEKRVYNQKH